MDGSEVVFHSTKEAIGVHEILEAIVKKIPPPQNTVKKPLRALIFDRYTYTCYNILHPRKGKVWRLEMNKKNEMWLQKLFSFIFYLIFSLIFYKNYC